MPPKSRRVGELRRKTALATGDFHTLLSGSRVTPLPANVLHLVQLCEDADSSVAAVAEVIAVDPGLAAWLLRLANSAAFGVAVRIGDVRRAITMLGMRRVRNLALGRAAVGNLRELGGPDHDADRFWAESLMPGILAEEIARRLVPSAEGESFTGGLLQDLAVPILLEVCPEDYGSLVVDTTGPALAEIESETLGWTHAQAGAWLASSWNFPDELVCVIGMHHEDPETIVERGLENTPVGVVTLTGRLSSPCDPSDEERAEFVTRLQHWYEVSEETVDDLLAGATARFCDALEVFDLPRPERA